VRTVSGNSKHRGRTVISKISSILLVVAEDNPQKLTEIATRSQLPLSTAHRLTNELADWQVLERDADGGFRIGAAFRSSDGRRFHGAAEVADGIRACAAPIMEDIFRATRMPVRIGYLDDAQVAYIEKISPFYPVSRYVPAARLPPHATAIGKVLLAYSSTTVVDAVLATPLRRFTPLTVTIPEELRTAFRAVRAHRIAVSERELDPTWTGVAAPVFGVGGSIAAAIEVRVRDLPRDLTAARTALGIATACLSRDLAQVHFDAPPPVRLINQLAKSAAGKPRSAVTDLASQVAAGSELA
jgi:DNA-binding IclR family transcriptional regulator